MKDGNTEKKKEWQNARPVNERYTQQEQWGAFLWREGIKGDRGSRMKERGGEDEMQQMDIERGLRKLFGPREIKQRGQDL